MSIELNKIPEKDEQHVIAQSEGDKIQLSDQNGKPEDHIDDNALPKEDPIDEDPDKELKKNLMLKIGLVSQEPVLFKRSVYENILYGRLDATREEVFNSAKRAAIEKFFNKKELGTKEDPVSGGEKQRLA